MVPYDDYGTVASPGAPSPGGTAAPAATPGARPAASESRPVATSTTPDVVPTSAATPAPRPDLPAGFGDGVIVEEVRE